MENADNIVEPTEQEEENDIVVQATPLFRTTVRKAVSPYLPPPVVSAIRDVDPLLEPYVGPEACVTLTTSVLLGLLIWNFFKRVSHIASSKRSAIVDDDDEDDLVASSRTRDFGDSVLLCGPAGAGKTRLFYALAHGECNAPTVTSMRPNVGFVSTTKDEPPVRCMDYPGHASWQSPQLQAVLSSVNRFVLVLDSTQPIAPAADVLYQILGQNSTKTSVFVACHKVDAPNSKNWRRIKIQLRTELERLLKVRASEEEGSDEKLWWPPGKPLDLDQLTNARLCFGSTSCEEERQGLDDLMKFVQTGDYPEATGKAPQIRRV